MADQHKLTVNTHRGQEFHTCLGTGCINSPGYAQRNADAIIRQTKYKIRQPYIDDQLVQSKTFQLHLLHLEDLFNVYQRFNLTLSSPKCYVGYPSITMLGRRVNGYGCATTAQKLKAIRNISFPKTLKQLEIYLGLTGWLREYVAYYAQLADPLAKEKTRLLRGCPNTPAAQRQYVANIKIKENQQLQDAFSAIQEAILSSSVLVHHDPARVLYVDINALKQRGFSVMACHIKGEPQNLDDILASRGKVKPLLFLSKVLSATEMNY
jgi:hypothetical protein